MDLSGGKEKDIRSTNSTTICPILSSSPPTLPPTHVTSAISLDAYDHEGIRAAGIIILGLTLADDQVAVRVEDGVDQLPARYLQVRDREDDGDMPAAAGGGAAWGGYRRRCPHRVRPAPAPPPSGGRRAAEAVPEVRRREPAPVQILPKVWADVSEVTREGKGDRIGFARRGPAQMDDRKA